MLYRVTVDLYFEKETDAQAVFGAVKISKSKAVKLIRPNSSLDMPDPKTYVEIHKCYHDEYPFKPCEIIERIEV